MRIALATCSGIPRPDTDLPHLVDAFAARAIEACVCEWDDPAVDWAAFDAVVVRSTWDYVQRFDAFLAWIARVDAVTRILNPAAVLRWNLDKRYLIELAGEGVPVVPTEFVPRGMQPDWDALFARFGDLVLKPAVSAGSFATVRVARGDCAAAGAHLAAHSARDFLVQPLLAAVLAHGETNLVHLGGRFSHAVRKAARWDGDGEQSRGVVEAESDELALAARIGAWLGSKENRSRGFGPLAYARIDLARGADGSPLLMELELVEPALFIDRAPASAGIFVEGVRGLVARSS